MLKLKPINKLESKSRCWDKLYGHDEVDMTKGLIELCGKWIKSDMVGVEVGSFAGISGEVISSHCKKLICVDCWARCSDSGYGELSRDRLELAEQKFDLMLLSCGNMEKRVGFSLDICKMFGDNSLDFIYIDGAHDYKSVYADLVAWRGKVKVGGLLMGHDKNNADVQRALDDVGIVVVEEFCDSSWVGIKK